MRYKRKFEVWENEGAFFYDPWLSRVGDSSESWRASFDRIPKAVQLEFLKDVRRGGRIKNPHEARLLVDLAEAAIEALINLEVPDPPPPPPPHYDHWCDEPHDCCDGHHWSCEDKGSCKLPSEARCPEHS